MLRCYLHLSWHCLYQYNVILWYCLYQYDAILESGRQNISKIVILSKYTGTNLISRMKLYSVHKYKKNLPAISLFYAHLLSKTLKRDHNRRLVDTPVEEGGKYPWVALHYPVLFHSHSFNLAKGLNQGWLKVIITIATSLAAMPSPNPSSNTLPPLVGRSSISLTFHNS